MTDESKYKEVLYNTIFVNVNFVNNYLKRKESIEFHENNCTWNIEYIKLY